MKHQVVKLNYFLYAGLTVIALSTFLCLLFPGYFFSGFESEFIKEMSGFSSLFYLFLVLIFAPIVEEFCFRSWVMKHAVWKFISFVGTCFYSYIFSKSIVYLCIVALILFYLFFVLNKEKLRLVLLVSLSSLFFGIAHLGNFSEGPFQIPLVFVLAAVGMIFCYLGLRFRFYVSILAHFGYNLTLILVSFLFITNYSGEIDKPAYNAKISKDNQFEFKICQLDYTDVFTNIVYRGWGEDPYLTSDKDFTLSFSGSIDKIAHSIIGYNRDTIYKYFPMILNNYDYVAESKDYTGLSRRELFKDLVEYANLKLDTSKVNAYTLKVVDTLKLTDIKDSIVAQARYSLNYFVRVLRDQYKSPVIIDEAASKFEIYRYESIPSYDGYGKTKEAYIEYIEKEYGIVLQEETQRDAVIISISEQY